MFNEYYDRQGKIYFYDLLKEIASADTLTQEEYLDWGHTETFKTEIGVGECAGVTIDLVSTLLLEGEEKLSNAEEALKTVKDWEEFNKEDENEKKKKKK